MTRKHLVTSVAVMALCFGLPALGPGGGSGDNSATIVQAGETGGSASQNQPGGLGNTASITQSGGTDDIAVQQQNRESWTPSRRATGRRIVTRASRKPATTRRRRAQTDNSTNGTQTITQIVNTRAALRHADHQRS